MSLERHHLQLLLALAQTGQLGRAAEALSISPSAASHRLREAERRIGFALIEPEGRSVRLTPAGVHLASAAEVAEDVVRSAERGARWLSATSPASVRVALDHLDRTPWFERLAGAGRFPFRVDLLRVDFHGAANAVNRRTVDVGLTVLPEHDEPGEMVLASDELAAAVPVGHPADRRGVLVPEDLETLPYLTTDGIPRPGFEFHGFMQPARTFPRQFVIVESIWSTLALVANGRGLTIQPRLTLEPAHPGTVVVPLAGASIPLRWEALVRRERTPETELFVTAMVEALSA